MQTEREKPWDDIATMLRSGQDTAEVARLVDSLSFEDLLHAVYLLKPDEQRALLAALPPEKAAELIDELPGGHAADLFEEMPVEHTVPIVEELPSNRRVDVLSELDQEDADAIIAELDEEDASEVRDLITYAPDQAGGLMMTEFASYPMAATVREVVDDLTAEEVDYQLLTVHYIYVVVRQIAERGIRWHRKRCGRQVADLFLGIREHQVPQPDDAFQLALADDHVDVVHGQ